GELEARHRPGKPDESGKGRCLLRLELQEVLAVVLEFLDRLVDVCERLVLALLDEALREFGLPAPRQLFQGADVQVAIVKISLETRQVAREEAPVLANRVAAHGRSLAGNVLRKEREQSLLSRSFGQHRGRPLRYQSGR